MPVVGVADPGLAVRDQLLLAIDGCRSSGGVGHTEPPTRDWGCWAVPTHPPSAGARAVL